MLNEVTKQIMSMVEAAEQKKRSLDDAIKRLQDKRDKDKARLVRDELALAKMTGDSEVLKGAHMRKIVEETKTVMDEDHELSDLNRKRADIDRKITEIKHWTAQSEHDDERARAEALSYASKIYNSL